MQIPEDADLGESCDTMQPHPLGAAGFAASMLILSLMGCGGDCDGAGADRPLRPVSEDWWSGGAVCYGPHRDGQRPGGPSPTAAEIREDLALMLPHWNLLRTYGASEFARTMLAEIRAGDLDLKVMLGVWIAAEEQRDERGAVRERFPAAAAANEREVAAAIDLVAEYADIVVAVCVGNEPQVSWSPNPCPLDLLVAYVRRVRAAGTVPVTAADDYQYWTEPASRALAREVDFVTIHAHPLWNSRQLDEAVPWLRAQRAAVAAVHPDRPVVIGETGWATAMADVGDQARLIRGATGEAEQAAFYRAARAWAAAERVPLVVFEAFDVNWKGGDRPDEVEKHWGLFRADRSPKAALAGAVGP